MNKFIAVLIAASALAVNAEITPETEFGDIAPTAKLSQVVSGAGALTNDANYLKFDIPSNRLVRIGNSTQFHYMPQSWLLLDGASLDVNRGAVDIYPGSTVDVRSNATFQVAKGANFLVYGNRSFADYGLPDPASKYLPLEGGTVTGELEVGDNLSAHGIYNHGGSTFSGYNYFLEDGETEVEGRWTFRDSAQVDVLGPLYLGSDALLQISDPSKIWLGYEDGEHWDRSFGSYETLDERIVRLAPAPGDYANVSNAAMNAASAADLASSTNALRRKDDLAVYEVTFGEWDFSEQSAIIPSMVWSTEIEQPDIIIGDASYRYVLYRNGQHHGMCRSTAGYATRADAEGATEIVWMQDAILKNTRTVRTRSYGPGSDSLAKVSQLPPAPDYTTNNTVLVDTIGAKAATKSEMNETKAIVQTWESFLDGSNVVFSITNYISGTYQLGAAKLRVLELRDGEYREVYNSRDEIVLHIADFETNNVNPAIAALRTDVETRIAGKADKAWGRYTSAGGDAPSNTVYMTEPQTVFAGGMEYERVAVGEGSVCVLTTHGAPVYTQGDEGTFKFQDDGGTNFFGFAKTDSYTIGCNTDGISVDNQIVTLTYNVTMSGVPCVWYKADLSSNAPWEQLNTPDGEPVPGASHAVTWEASPEAGSEVCYINCPEPKGFFKATIEVAGDAKFMTNMPADLEGGILCTDGQHKVAIDWNNGNPRLVEVQ